MNTRLEHEDQGLWNHLIMYQHVHVMDTAVALILTIWSFSKATKYLENHNLWTLRLRLSIVEHLLFIPSIFIAWIALAHTFIFHLPPSFHHFRFSISLIYAAGTFIGILEYVLPVYHNRRYLRLRWKAWGGPSRTGIKAELVSYIGDRRDWVTLEALAKGKVTMHPIERFSRISFFSRRRLIVSDITSLLLARATADQRDDTLWVPESDARQGVFQPILPGEPASLLWGEHIGFQRRCSRGIISVPRAILSPWPMLADGVDARGLCLATGILSRNKGLQPTSFICNLATKGNIEKFEQNSVFWPYPAKTFRSLYRRECQHYFSGLGQAFVTVATELALLLIEAPVEVAEDWLDARLEHQDLRLNHEAYALGAQPQELEILYRGQYAAMLVSLGAHQVGIRIRPEMLVYKAVCKKIGVIPGAWAMLADMGIRSEQELEAIGPRVVDLIDAVVG